MCTKCTTIAYKGMSFSVFTTFQTKREKNSFHVQLKKIKKKKNNKTKNIWVGLWKLGLCACLRKRKPSLKCHVLYVVLRYLLHYWFFFYWHIFLLLYVHISFRNVSPFMIAALTERYSSSLCMISRLFRLDILSRTFNDPSGSLNDLSGNLKFISLV